MVTQREFLERFNFASFATVTETPTRMLSETATERPANVWSASTTRPAHIATSAFLVISVILTLCLTDLAMHARATLEERFKLRTEFPSAIKFRAIATVSQMWSARTVTNARMDSGTSPAERDVKAANVTRRARTTLHVTRTLVSASASQESPDFDATSAKLTNTASRPRVARLAIAMSADRKAHSATNTVNAHVTTTLKAEHATGARRTNTTDIRDAWTARHATTWFKMQSMNIAKSSQHSTRFWWKFPKIRR